MENENSNETYQKAIEKHVLEGLVSFFENPDNFDNIVLSARYEIEQLTQKLDNIADRLVEIDKRLDDPQAMVINILRKVSTGELSENVGAAMLRFTEDIKLRLQEERLELELKEAQLCKQISAMERFEDCGQWCYLYPRQLNVSEKIDLLKVITDRVQAQVEEEAHSYETLLTQVKEKAKTEAAARAKDVSAIDHCNRGTDYYEEDEYDRAILQFNRAIEINSGFAEAYCNRGTAYYAKYEYDKAISDYNNALEINPKDAMAYNNRGLAYYHTGEYDKAWNDVHQAQSMGYQIPT